MRKIIYFFVIFIINIAILSGCAIDTYSRVGGNHLHLNSEKKELFWFSGIHSNDPEHRMFNDIKKEFESFQPDLVLVEGGANKTKYKNKNDSILRGGEPGFVSYLAMENNIELENIEPSNSEVNKYLLNKYEKDDVLAMLILRQINQKQREVDNVEVVFDQYFTAFLSNIIKEGLSVNEDKVNLNYIADLLEPYIGFKVNNSNWKDIKTKNIVYFHDGIIHEIWKDSIEFRDNHVVELIQKRMKEYDKIFVMMGFDHAKNQEENLRKIFDEYNKI